MEWLLTGAVVLIIVLALCNPRLWRDLKNRRGSMDDVMDQGREDLEAALRARKNKKRDGEE